MAGEEDLTADYADNDALASALTPLVYDADAARAEAFGIGGGNDAGESPEGESGGESAPGESPEGESGGESAVAGLLQMLIAVKNVSYHL